MEKSMVGSELKEKERISFEIMVRIKKERINFLYLPPQDLYFKEIPNCLLNKEDKMVVQKMINKILERGYGVVISNDITEIIGDYVIINFQIHLFKLDDYKRENQETWNEMENEMK